MRFPGFRERTDTVTPLTTTGGGATTLGAAPAYTTGGHPLNQVVHETRDTRVAHHDADRVAQDLDKAEKAAYQKGLRDGVRAKRNNPIVTILVLLLAVFGIAVGVLAIMEGSFGAGGQRLDRLGGAAAVEARDTGGELAQDAGAALQEGGAEVEREAEAARQ